MPILPWRPSEELIADLTFKGTVLIVVTYYGQQSMYERRIQRLGDFEMNEAGDTIPSTRTGLNSVLTKDHVLNLVQAIDSLLYLQANIVSHTI